MANSEEILKELFIILTKDYVLNAPTDKPVKVALEFLKTSVQNLSIKLVVQNTIAYVQIRNMGVLTNIF